MFGLMRFNTCHKTDEELYQRRMLYCGTCKAIGAEFGQSARLMLNNDVVFLAELLQSISEDSDDLTGWATELQSYNCFSLPNEAEIPRTLKIASAVSMILSELKLDDHVEDSGALFFRGARRYLEPVFSKSEVEFANLKFPILEIRHWYSQQAIREQVVPEQVCREQAERDRIICNQSEQRLRYFAEPTAMITALVFEHSATTICGGASSTSPAIMRRLGFNFGTLIYVIDALEDIKRDLLTKSFNAIASGFEFSAALAPDAVIDDVETFVVKLVGDLIDDFNRLPIEAAQREEYAKRLTANVRRITGFDLDVSSCHSTKKSHTCVSKQKSNSLSSCSDQQPALSRWSTACLKAKQVSAEFRSTCAPGALRLINVSFRAFAYTLVLFVSLLSPLQTRSIHSYRQCVELPFNLIFWGSAINTVVTAIAASRVKGRNIGLSHAYAMVGSTGGGGDDEQKERRKRGEFMNGHKQERLNEQASPKEDPKRPLQKGVNNQDKYRRSREFDSHPTPCWGPCFCDGGCEACGECGECCVSTDGCCESCGHCDSACVGAECCAGGGHCCASADCCAGAGDCCGSGGADCCASAEACGACADCAGGCSSC